MSKPYTPRECRYCRYFDRLDPPVRDDAGYEIVGLRGHPRIAMDLFRMRTREEPAIAPASWWYGRRADARVAEALKLAFERVPRR